MSGMTCANCGKPADEHWAVNYANGQHVTASVLVCPTSAFVANLRAWNPLPAGVKSAIPPKVQGETT